LVGSRAGRVALLKLEDHDSHGIVRKDRWKEYAKDGKDTSRFKKLFFQSYLIKLIF
jgi:hypothetical protein